MMSSEQGPSLSVNPSEKESLYQKKSFETNSDNFEEFTKRKPSLKSTTKTLKQRKEEKLNMFLLQSNSTSF